MYRTKSGLYRKQVTIDGKRVVFNGRTQREVYQRIAEYQQKKSGTFFRTVAREWWNSIEGVLSPTTIRGYNSAYDRAVEWFGDEYVEDITSKQIAQYLSRFSDKAQSTIANYLLIVRLICEYACANYGLESNPALNIKAPKGRGRKEREYPTEDEISAVIAHASYTYKEIPIGLLMLVCLQSGLRRGEVCALRYKDIDRDKNVIHVTQSVYWDASNKPHLKTPKSAAGVRDVPLLPAIADLIGRGSPTAYIFGGEEPLHQHQIGRALQAYKRDTGIAITPHGLRHGYASVAFAAGLDVKTVQTLLGHAQAQTSMEIYVHVIEKDKIAKAGRQISEFFDAHAAHTADENSTE